MDKLDVLNRQEFVNTVIKLTEQLSANKKNTSFAINGDWGVGKSFVLDMYQEQLSQIQTEETAKDKYFIVRYNCWKFDYYEEPLIAIVSNLIETIEQNTKLFPDSAKKSKILGVFKAIGVSLLSMANSAVRHKTGVDLGKAYEVAKKGFDDGAKSYEQNHAYDVYFGFNKAITYLQKALNDIAKEYNIIFLVDELDRCLPEYEIRVLERLHHITENVQNIITVIAIDKNQLQRSIGKIFCVDNEKKEIFDKYLKKFIHFELALDKGKVSEKFIEKYYDYVNLFDNSIWEIKDSIEEFFQEVFKNIDARIQNNIVDRAFLVHNLLFDDKKDYSFMCLELLMVITNVVYKSETIITRWLKPLIRLSGGVTTIFDNFLNKKLEQSKIHIQHISEIRKDEYVFEEKNSLYSIIIFSWLKIFLEEYANVKYCFEDKQSQEYFIKNIEDLKKFLEVVKIIK